ncbi:hypothetical protein [Actinopolymorpha pittospori]|uniref:Uncharacterized protein n=1 Tax=Actinopolymorpha pittospori TaxID=648752 RepID=A0A927R9M0_9ACTN|nr:hypothetical protein [Actinopolymorpha pittospori]MBE1607982.1 hypothetical protein [Actinopolymorpha pittospori]
MTSRRGRERTPTHPSGHFWSRWPDQATPPPSVLGRANPDGPTQDWDRKLNSVERCLLAHTPPVVVYDHFAAA